jgi:hypothetical protein
LHAEDTALDIIAGRDRVIPSLEGRAHGGARRARVASVVAGRHNTAVSIFGVERLPPFGANAFLILVS